MGYPVSNWRVIAQLSKIMNEGKNNLLVTATFYVTYQEPICFKSVRLRHCPEPDKKVNAKEYKYTAGYDQMLKEYKKLIDGDSPYTEIMPLLTKREIWDEIKYCRERVEHSDKFKTDPDDELQ